MNLLKRLIILLALTLATGTAVTFVAPDTASASTAGCQFRQAGSARPIVKSKRSTYRKAKQWIYGDSITWQSYRNLTKTLPGRQAVDAVWGRNTASAVNALARDVRRNRKHLPKVVVMAVGTNDKQDVANFRRQVVRARGLLPKSVRLVWVNAYFEPATSYNQLGQALQSVRGVGVVSWAAVNRAHRVDGHSTLLYDGVHVTLMGCVLRNQAIKRALR
jgi:hypothetical protein